VTIVIEQRDGTIGIQAHDDLCRHLQKPLCLILAFLEFLFQFYPVSAGSYTIADVLAEEDEVRCFMLAGHAGYGELEPSCPGDMGSSYCLPVDRPFSWASAMAAMMMFAAGWTAIYPPPESDEFFYGRYRRLGSG
jgi:hypothetical protein